VTTPTNALAGAEYLPRCNGSRQETPGVNCRKPNDVNPGAEEQKYALAQSEYLPVCGGARWETPGQNCRQANAHNPGATKMAYESRAQMESHVNTCTGARWETPGVNCRKANTFNKDVDYMYNTHYSTLAQAGDLPPCKADSNYNKRQIPGHTCWIQPTGSAPAYPSAAGDDDKKQKKESLVQALPYCTGVSNERVGLDCQNYPEVKSTFAQLESLPYCTGVSNE